MNWSALDWGILGPALIAGLLVLSTHVPLGTQVLDRGIVFIDLAIAQTAGLGVIAADTFGLPEGGVAVQAAAVCAALLGALLLTWTERRAPQQQEALIGVMFILAACAGILLLSGNPHGGEHLKDLLVGQILWVNTAQLAWLGGISVLLLLAMRLGIDGSAGRRVSRVLEPHHPGAGHRRAARRAALCGGLRARCARLCARARAVGAVRPALGCGDRLDPGDVLAGCGGSGCPPGRRNVTVTAASGPTRGSSPRRLHDFRLGVPGEADAAADVRLHGVSAVWATAAL